MDREPLIVLVLLPLLSTVIEIIVVNIQTVVGVAHGIHLMTSGWHVERLSFILDLLNSVNHRRVAYSIKSCSMSRRLRGGQLVQNTHGSLRLGG